MWIKAPDGLSHLDRELRNENQEGMDNFSNSKCGSVPCQCSSLRGEGRESAREDRRCKCGSKPRGAPEVPEQCVCGRKTT